MPAELLSTEDFQLRDKLAEESFFDSAEAVVDEKYWTPEESETRFKLRVIERLHRNHPDMAPKYVGSEPLYSIENDGSMLVAVWMIMIVRENRWRENHQKP
jgi:hypothetical protein